MWAGDTYVKDPHRARDILEQLLSGVFERQFELALHILPDPLRNADAARPRQSFEACCHVHSVTMEASALEDHVADVDSHSEYDPLSGRHLFVPTDHLALNIDSAPQAIDDARK